jgi:hypothetical protein
MATKQSSEERNEQHGREAEENGQAAAQRARAQFERTRQAVGSTMRRWPLAGAAAMGGLGVVAAMAIGVGEVAVGAAIGYATYRLITRRGADAHDEGAAR